MPTWLNTSLSADLVFANGTRGSLSEDGVTAVSVKGLSAGTQYKIYIAAADSEGNLFDDVLCVEATTAEQSEAIEVHDITKNSVVISVKVPQSVKEAGNVIKWGYTSLPVYMMNQMYGMIEPLALNSNDDYYHSYFDDDFSVTISETSGDLYWMDPEGDINARFDAPVPGEPGVFMMGEYAYRKESEMDDDDEDWGAWGWGDGYYKPLFDYEAYIGGGSQGEPGEYDPWDDIDPGFGIMYSQKAASKGGSVTDINSLSEYWTGFNATMLINFEAPEEYDADIEMVPDITPYGGTVTVNAGEDVYAWCAAVWDDDMYEQVLNGILAGDKDYLQWFVTSYYSNYYGYSFTGYESAYLDMEDLLYVSPGDKIHVMLCAIDGNQGSRQKFIEKEFTLPECTKDAPEVVVTPVSAPAGQEESPYMIWFNIKCPGKDAVLASYLCHYEKEIVPYLKKQYDLRSLFRTGANRFSAEEVALINSDEGYTIGFSTSADMSSGLAVAVFNDEGSMSDYSLACQRSGSETVARVESSLFEELAGEWTATTTINIVETEYDLDKGDYVIVGESPLEVSSPVTIGAVTYPAKLDEEAYAVYEELTGKTPEEVDAEYELFKGYADEFNQRTRGLNRILCQGFDMEDHDSYEQSLVLQTPYDLFVSSSYSGYDSESPLIDFGPKWYLEVDAAGNVTVPFSYEKDIPASGHYDPYHYFVTTAYLAGCYYNTNSHQSGFLGEGAFPVEVSADRNTIRIKPILYNGRRYYPQMWTKSYGGNLECNPVIADVILTREACEDLEPAPEAARSKVPALVQTEAPARSGYARKARTALPSVAETPSQRVSVKVVTLDRFKSDVKAFMEARKAK